MAGAVEVAGLVKSFKETKALAGVDLEVPEGTVLGLLGPNGAGKTTIVRVLATLLLADAGTRERLRARRGAGRREGARDDRVSPASTPAWTST